MKHGSLESGLGGFDYAAEKLGWDNVFHCEINPFCQQILKHYWPNAKSYTDIFEFDARKWRGKVDIITAGFPCQPFSHAGKRKGSTDERFIWPENMRIFREVKPRFIVAENVPGLLTIENGMVFEQVCADLENEGYEAQAFIVPACAKDAVHRRDRVWIVAYNSGNRLQRSKIGRNVCNEWQESHDEQIGGCNQSYSFTTNTKSIGQPGSGQHRASGNTVPDADRQINRIINDSKQQESWFEAATRLCSVDDEFAGKLDTASISKSKWRTESLKAYGNAIYWPVAYEIFKAIEQTEDLFA